MILKIIVKVNEWFLSKSNKYILTLVNIYSELFKQLFIKMYIIFFRYVSYLLPKTELQKLSF